MRPKTRLYKFLSLFYVTKYCACLYEQRVVGWLVGETITYTISIYYSLSLFTCALQATRRRTPLYYLCGVFFYEATAAAVIEVARAGSCVICLPMLG